MIRRARTLPTPGNDSRTLTTLSFATMSSLSLWAKWSGSDNRFSFNRALFLPGLTVTVKEMLDSLKRAGGQIAVDRVKFVPDMGIRKIVAGWPMRFDSTRAKGLGFKADDSFDQIVEGFVQDDLRRNAA